MIYYTYDTDGYGNGTAEENATFKTFDGTAEQLQQLLNIEHNNDDLRPVVREADFGDCWIKLYDDTEPTPERLEYTIEPFTFEQVHIQKPGSHPGGSAYWISPAVQTYVVEFYIVEEAA